MLGAQTTNNPPLALKVAKASVLLIANAIVAVIVKRILEVSGVLDKVGEWGGEILQTQIDVIGWAFALLFSITITGLLLWLVSANRSRRNETERSHDILPAAEKMDARLRSHYLKNLQRDVENRLAASIHHACFLDLEIDDRSSAVTPWTYRNPDANEDFNDAWEAFTKFGGRLLILGSPGAGKTTAALHIAQKLIANAVLDDEAPLPVLINLSKFRMATSGRSSWLGFRKNAAAPDDDAASGRGFEEWLVAELAAIPGIDKRTAKKWPEGGQIAPLLDGLDEFNDDRRPELVEILNTHFLKKYGTIPVLICSRINEYESLRGVDRSLKLNGCIQLQPLDDERIKEYLQKAKADELLSILAQDEALRELAKTPLTLSMLALAYGGVSAGSIKRSESFSITRFQLFESYVARMLQRQARRRAGVQFDASSKNDVAIEKYRYQPGAIDRWLGWLALTLSVRMRTTFSPDGMVRLLLVRNRPERQLLTFLIAHFSLATLAVIPLTLAAAGLTAPTQAAICFSVLIVFGSWLAMPLAAAGHQDWPAGVICLVLSVLAMIVLAVAVTSVALAETGILPLTSADLVPCILAGWLGLVLFESTDRKVGLGFFATSAVTAVAASMLTGFSTSLAESSAVSTFASPTLINSAFANAIMAVGIAGLAFAEDEEWGTAIIVSVIVGGAGFAVSCLVHFVPVLDARAAMIWAASIFIVLYVTSSQAKLTLLIAGILGVAVFGSGMTLPVEATVIVLAIGATGAFLYFVEFPGRSNAVEGLAESYLGWADGVLLSRIARCLLALSRRLPVAFGRFVFSSTDAFLLKRSGQEIEFSHRLIRDYFALRELLPRLDAGASNRVQVIRSLGFQGEAALDLLQEEIQSEDGATRAAAVEALSHIASPASVTSLQKAVADVSLEVRLSLLRTLDRLPLESQVEFLKDMLPLSPRDEMEALLLAWPRGGPYWRAAPPPLDKHEADPRAEFASNGQRFDQDGRLGIVYAGKMGDAGIAALEAILGRRSMPTVSKGDDALLVPAMYYIHELAGDSALDVFIHLASHRSATVRSEVADHLRRFSDPRAIQALQMLGRDKNRSVRSNAQKMLTYPK